MTMLVFATGHAMYEYVGVEAAVRPVIPVLRAHGGSLLYVWIVMFVAAASLIALAMSVVSPVDLPLESIEGSPHANGRQHGQQSGRAAVANLVDVTGSRRARSFE